MKKIIAAILLLSLTLGLTACGGQKSEPAKNTSESSSQVTAKDNKDDVKPKEFTMAVLPQIDVWPIYQAFQSGDNKKFGFDDISKKNMLKFESGMEAVEGIPAGAFSIGSVGALPAVMASLRYDAEIVGVASDESAANAILARSDSPVFNHPHQDLQNVYGAAEDVKGKTILITSVSSSHDTVDRWLKTMGLTEKDVTIQTVEQQTAIQSFEAGDGDFIVLWAPNMYRALDAGNKVVATASDLGGHAPMVYIAPKKWAEANPDKIAHFLAMINPEIEAYQSKGQSLAADVKKFFEDFAGVDMTEADAQQEIARHHLFTIDEQMKLMQDGTLEKWLLSNAETFANEGKIKPEELKELKEKHFNIMDKYLKDAKQVKPAA